MQDIIDAGMSSCNPTVPAFSGVPIEFDGTGVNVAVPDCSSFEYSSLDITITSSSVRTISECLLKFKDSELEHICKKD